MRLTTIFLLTLMLFSSISCGDSGVNIFSVQDDVMLGQQLRDEILADPEKYPVLDRNSYSSAYNYVQGVVNDILASGEIQYKDEFAWEIYLIDDPETLNAFAAPGGYIFVYTGILKFLDNKDDFAGVMGHEMAHADRRHSTNQLTKQYGISLLLSLVSGGDPNTLSQVLASLVGLKFSRDHESEADEYSVIYLCETPYAANGAASFFEKLINQGTASPPAFLSTHPNPDDRVSDINMEASERGCDTTFNSSASEWHNFQNLLP
ncbi:MAG: M48 family metalloprotease [Saprospiraceae bacterium]|nr:M48 family metalloprotease [Saprospiraceae bacterium]